MLSSKLLLLLIGSIAISSSFAAEEDWGLDGEAQEVSKRIQDFNDDDDDDDDDDDGNILAMEEDDFDNIDELLGRELARNVAKGQWGWFKRTFRKVKRFVRKHANCKNARRACAFARRSRNPKVYLICRGVGIACSLG